MPRTNAEHIAPQIHEQMESLRQRIRRYVWIEGLAMAIVWLCLTFWIGWAIDYLPVRMGSSEMPRAARAVLLVVISLVLLLILYRFVLRRAFAQLRARNLAVLLERAFPEFRDSLVTAVELDETSAESEIGKELLTAARKEAAEKVEQIDVGKVLNYRPLIRACGLAALLLLSVILFGVVANTAFAVWFQRLYGLSDELYPRRTKIEAVGFENGEITVARGSDLRLRVRADANRSTRPPKVCTIFFTTSNGRRGRVNMSKQGLVRDGFQSYLYEGKPFRNILASVEFDVVGGDHRLSNYRVRVVDSPQITGIEVNSSLPDYTGLLPRSESYHAGMQLVRGSSVELALMTNKPIVEATVTDTATGEVATIPIEAEDRQHFVYRVGEFTSALSHDIALLDRDGIRSARPYRVAIGALEDGPPQVVVRLQAIGSAVTPDANIPIEGNVQDDFGVQRSWVELVVKEGGTRQIPVVVASDDRLEISVDLRELRRNIKDPLNLEVDSKLFLAVLAQDRCNIGQEGNIGESDRYELDIVSPGQLLAMLEAREIGLHRRFQQIIEETQASRDSLARVRAVPLPKRAGQVPAEKPEESASDAKLEELEDMVENSGSPDDSAAGLVRQRALMQLRVQRAIQQTERAAQEILGVALSFDDIRHELVNNRVDSTDRQTRMERDISIPLKRVVNEMFPDLSDRLGALESNLYDPEQTDDLTVASVRQVDEILSELKMVLSKMLDLESYNELIDHIRALIREQDNLIDKTKKKRKKSALDLLK
jgi:hypothetical protein